MDLTLQQKTAALSAGLALLATAVVAGGANGVVIAPLADLSAADLVAELTRSPTAFRAATLALVAVPVLDVVVAWSLRAFLAPAGRLLADVQAALQTVSATVLAVAVGHLLAAERVVRAGGPAGQVRAEVDAFFDVWSLSLGVFAVHLLVVAVLLARMPGAARIIAVLVAVCGLGYLVDTVTHVLTSGDGTSVTSVTFVGEVVLLGWLLWGARGRVPVRELTPA